MKKLFNTLLLTCVCMHLFSQAHNKGTFSFQLNYQTGLHKTIYESTYYGNLVDRDTRAALTSLFNFTAQYNFIKPFSAGINFSSGRYIEDPEDAEADGNKVNTLSLDLRAYLVNKEKFNWFLSLDYGIANLEINRIYTFITSFRYKYLFKSPHFSLYTGFNWYFAKFIGMNFQLGYSGHNFLMNKLWINGDEQDISNLKNTLQATGVNIRLGLSIKIN